MLLRMDVITQKELAMNKKEQIAKRRFKLLDYLSTFGEFGCLNPMDKTAVEVGCSKKQLRLDIDYLISKGVITAKPYGKRSRILISPYRSSNYYPTAMRYKVYDVEPLTAFDIDLNGRGYTAREYYGKWHWNYYIPKGHNTYRDAYTERLLSMV